VVAGEAGSAIDHLFLAAKQNSELTSVALVGLEELVQGVLHKNGKLNALSIRQLSDNGKAKGQRKGYPPRGQ